MMQKTVKVNENELLVSVDYQGKSRAAFLLYNTHSLPVRKKAANEAMDRVCETSNETLTIEYAVSATKLPRQVLKNLIPDGTVEPRHPLKLPFIAPFFYEDSRHVFYVTSKAGEPVWINDHYGVPIPPMPRYVTEDAYIRRSTGAAGNVKYGDRDIGPSGSIPDVRNEK